MRVAVFGSSLTTPEEDDYRLGRQLGELLAGDGHIVFTGGYGGLMEAVSEGAAGAGGHVVGVTAAAVFPSRSGANRHVSQIIDARTLAHRIHRIVDGTDASIALPGSIGTLTELMVAWNSAHVARFSDRRPKPVIALGETWKTMVENLVEFLQTDASLVSWADSPRAALEMLRRWQEDG